MSNVVHRSIRKTALPRTGRTLDAVPSSATGSGSGSGAVGSSGSGVKDHSQLTGVISTIDEYKDSAKDIHLTATDADALKRLSTLEIIESTDTETIPGETNVYSALLSKKEDSKRLRKDVADTASKLITFMEGLVSRMKAVLESGADFGVDGSGGHIEATGEAEFLNLFLREYLKTDKIQSQDFHAGALGTGFLIKRDPVTGKSYAEVDELFVRIKAFFTELEIKKLSYAGGNWIFSAAGMKCVRVEDKGTFYRCYFTASNGETIVKNEFRVDDLCRSQEFNVKVGTSQNASSRYYWRLCVAVGEDYIDLSKSDCDTNSDAPVAGDSIVQLGNRSDVARQNAILISAYGEGSPSITQHTGIKSYSLLGTEKTRISPELNEFTGEFHFTTGENVKDEVDGAKTDAAAADSKAVAAQGTATAAKNRLDSWASDGVISPTEKVTLKTEQADIRAEKTEIVADAVKYNVGATAYVNAYTAYDSDLTYYTYASPENISILPTFATRQTAYYSARTVILAAIATAAKSYVDTGVGSAKSYTDTTFSAVDGKITLAVDSVKIGTKNLLRNSGVKVTNGNYGVSSYNITENLIEGEEYTVIYSGSFVGNQHCLFTGSTGYSLIMLPINETDGIKYASFTVTSINANTAALRIYNYPSSGSAANPATVEWVALYKGNIKPPMNWSPAPEDQTDYADQVANTVRTETNTKLEVLDGKIAQTVTKTEFNNLQIGGTNLLLNSALKNDVKDWGLYSGVTRVAGSYIYQGRNTFQNIQTGLVSNAYRGIQQTIVNINTGDIFTAGVWTYTDNLASIDNGAVLEIVFVAEDGTRVISKNIGIKPSKANTWEYFSFTTQAFPSNAVSVLYYVWIGKNGRIWFNGMKLERGNKATAWSPAPEDQVNEGKDYANATFPTKTVYESAITQLSDRIDLGVTKTEFNNLQIGGRNYIVGNKTYLDHEYHNVSVSNVILQRLSNGGAFTFSMRVNAKNMTAQRNELYLQLKDSNNEITQLSFPFNLSGNYTSKHIISTISVIAKSYISINAAMLITLGTSAGVQCYDLKLEEGNKATDYSPSPEDLENYVIDNYTSKTTYQSGISVLSDQINLRATKTEVTALDTRVSQAEIKLQPGNIWLGVKENVDTSINNVQVGGRNLILNTDRVYPTNGNEYTGIPISVSTFEIGETYTWSFDLKIEGNFPPPFTQIYHQSWGSVTQFPAFRINATQNWERYSVTFVWKDSAIFNPASSIEMSFYCNYGSRSFPRVRRIKLEKGNKATDWTPAPEDQNTYADNTAQSKADAAQGAAKGYTDGQIGSVTNKLYDTGIDIKNNQITVTGPTFCVQDNAGTPIAVFTTDSSGKPVLKAENIDVDNFYAKKLAANVGTIAKLRIDQSGLSNKDDDGGFDNDAFVFLKNDSRGTIAAIGGRVTGVASGSNFIGNFENHGVEPSSGANTNNQAIAVSARNALYNTAIQLGGGCIERFARKTQLMTANGAIHINTGTLITLNLTGTGITVYLPTVEEYDDGHEIDIKLANGGGIYLMTNPSYHLIYTNGRYVRTQKQSYMQVEGNAIYGEGKAYSVTGSQSFKMVYVSDMKSGSYHGCWVQFKYPVAW